MTGPAEIWILTDGKAGDEAPLIGVAEALGRPHALRRIRPRPLFAALAPYGPADPRDLRGEAALLAPPLPALCLAAGRRAVPCLRALKARSPATCTVFFRDPRTRRHGADLLCVQEHDRPRGPGILVTVTAPHRFSRARLAAARAAAPDAILALPRPRVAVLVGGDSRHHHFTPADAERLAQGLFALAEGGAGLMITLSRRSPERLAAALAPLSRRKGVILWTGGADNPLASFLAMADFVVVTADSINMIGEAAATGRPIHVFHPSGGHRKTRAFLAALGRQAVLRPFPGPLGGASYPPVDSTPEIAAAIRDMMGWSQ